MLETPAPVDTQLRDGVLQDVAQEMRLQVYRWLLATRPEKFEKFLKWVQRFRYGVCSCLRGDLMEDYYCAMRLPDDVGDRDHPLPQGYADRSEYIRERLAFARNPTNPKDAVDQVLLHCYHMAERLGFSLQTESELMLQSILFDAEREGKNIVYPEETLNENFYRLDIDGTESASLKIFGEDVDNLDGLRPLGIASRKFYNLRDFRDDIDEHGLINIPKEDMDLCDIQIDDLSEPNAASIRRWFAKEAGRITELLHTHGTNMSTMRLKKVTKFTLDRVYVRPIRKFLAQM